MVAFESKPANPAALSSPARSKCAKTVLLPQLYDIGIDHAVRLFNCTPVPGAVIFDLSQARPIRNPLHS